ncbi:membrane-spanning 4-domains subfamily A member 8-like [Pleurodeles waltl]|uniref:membrane-spanning 4-domains subfamily A member 8-like n=1 Tax=Pleurodeles waltl TaxID=8319 RepID=UPI00370954EE
MASPAGNGGYVVTQYVPPTNYGALKLNQSPEFTQMFIGGAQICLGVVLCAAFRLSIGFSIVTGIPFWPPVFFIISGVLSISVQNTTNHRLIRATLAMNIISSIFAGLGIITYSVDVNYYLWHATDGSADWGMTLVLLFLSFFELGIALATSAFGCITTCLCPPCYDSPQPMIIVQSGPTQDPVIPLAQMTGMPVAQVPMPQQLPMTMSSS